MTEAEWLSCTDPNAMLRCLLGHVGWRQSLGWLLGRRREAVELAPASPRQLRLLAVAGCRRITELLEDERSHVAIDVAERHADGQADDEELNDALQHADLVVLEHVARLDRPILPVGYQPTFALGNVWVKAAEAVVAAIRAPHLAPAVAAQAARLVVAEWDDPEWSRWAVQAAGPAAQVALIRDIFGNPFTEVAVDPAWLRWNDATVRRIAQGIYDEGRFTDLPILHDALIDAGCDDEDILAHCRQGEGHVCGCWVVDLLLGKG